MNSSNGNVDASDPELQWAALEGVWGFEGDHAEFRSPSPLSTTPHGLVLSNRKLKDGTVRVGVKFETLTPGPNGNSAAGIVIGYRSQNAGYLLPQLGGYGAAYAIAVFVPTRGWMRLASAGSAGNLVEMREYLFEVSIHGQRVHMSVDRVPIFDHALDAPLAGNQLGLFAWGQSKVMFQGLVTVQQPPRVFVAFQFSEPYNTLYREVIKPKAENLGFDVVQIGEKAGPGIIFEDIKREIERSNVVVAEITAPNQNVFYELGYAHALNKPTILLAQRGKELPFDIQSYLVIFYDDTIGGKPEVEESLERHLRALDQEY